jgi:ATP-dependent RNA helicase DDX10/DBP4
MESGQQSGPVLAAISDDDGYVSPVFDLPSSSDDDVPPPKRNKTFQIPQTIDDEEEIALRLLRTNR